MASSEARIRANRRNAKRSCGPKTPEGKAKVRCNALKHGLTGQGVALPAEDQAEITRRFSSLQIQLAPSNDLSEQLVRRVAFLTVRVERCEKHETSETSKRVRHAVAEFDDERLAAVEALAAKIEREPATTSRRLQATPEGIDWLLGQWEILRADLHRDEIRDCWTHNHRARFEMLLGENPVLWKIGRIFALSEGVTGFFLNMDKADGEGLEGPARAEWAKGELTRMMDEEVGRLKEARAALDPGAIARDRAEAVDRALFDPSPEMILARKYEAATERALYKALKELRQVEAEAAERRESTITVETDETCDPMALNLETAEDETSEDEPGPIPAPPRVPPTIFPLLERAKEGPIPVGTVPIGQA